MNDQDALNLALKVISLQEQFHAAHEDLVVTRNDLRQARQVMDDLRKANNGLEMQVDHLRDSVDALAEDLKCARERYIRYRKERDEARKELE